MKSSTRQIAQKRIQILFRQAKKAHATDPQLSSRYVATARKIAMSARMRLPVEYRHQICRNCNSLLVHGKNCRVRVRQRREPHVVVTCLNCGFQTRMPLRVKKEKTKIEQDNHAHETSR